MTGASKSKRSVAAPVQSQDETSGDPGNELSQLGGALPMFELVEQQPSHLACQDVLNLSLDSSDVERLERFFDSEDEDFEILSL